MLGLRQHYYSVVEWVRLLASNHTPLVYVGLNPTRASDYFGVMKLQVGSST